MNRRSNSVQSKYEKQMLYRSVRQFINKNVPNVVMFVEYANILKSVICCDFFLILNKYSSSCVILNQQFCFLFLKEDPKHSMSCRTPKTWIRTSIYLIRLVQLVSWLVSWLIQTQWPELHVRIDNPHPLSKFPRLVA
jgi:hypothetical protein